MRQLRQQAGRLKRIFSLEEDGNEYPEKTYPEESE
jgi:hypothetical protein